MKKSTIEKIEKEISEKTKLPNEIKEKIKKEVFTNIVIASIIIVYFILIVLGSVNSIKNVRTTDLNIFSLLFLGIAIFLFEKAYKKDDEKLAIYGIESLIIAIFTLFLPYIIFELNEVNRKYYLMAGICIGIYYILKSTIIYVIERNKYINNNISDVKEIVKKEKTKRRIKEDIEEVKEDKKINKEEDKISKSVKNDKTKTRTKKEVTVEIEKKNEKEESAPKKRGRPKKSETSKIENKQKVEVAQLMHTAPVKSKSSNRASTQGDSQPKKRGRPRKVVVNND